MDFSMLTMEMAARVALPQSPDGPLGIGAQSMAGFQREAQESFRRRALAHAAQALRALEGQGLRCGVFGSALRPGDFLAGSDVDVVAWRDDGQALGPAEAQAARAACHGAFGGASFDLVLLPCANQAFQERLLNGWSRGLAAVERASRGEPLGEPLLFGPADVAFIDADRLDIATRAAERMAARARSLGAGAPLTESDLLTLVAGAQTVARVAEKCAKDALRELCPDAKLSQASGPFYPLLAYPCEALGGQALASEASVALYLACLSRGEAPRAPCAVWARETAAIAGLFVKALRLSLEPALAAMARMAPRTIP